MKLRTLFTLILALTIGAFANITGTFNFGTATIHPTVQVGYQGNLYYISADGTFNVPTNDPLSIKTNSALSRKVLTKEYDLFGRKLNLNQTQSWASNFASFKQYSSVQGGSARSLAASTDTLYIVVGGDTLREVPITSWNQVLPQNYIVQRNVQVTVKAPYSSDTVQAVWFGDRDSIAHVLNLEHNSTHSGSFSGYIYTVYNDTDFQHNAHLYNLFVRTRSSDSIRSYSSILDVKAHVGDLVIDSAAFTPVTFHTLKGYSLTPNDSSIAAFSTKNISMVYVTDTLDSLATYDSSSFNYLVRHEADTTGYRMATRDSLTHSFILRDMHDTDGYVVFAVNPKMVDSTWNVGDTTNKVKSDSVYIKVIADTSISILYLTSSNVFQDSSTNLHSGSVVKFNITKNANTYLKINTNYLKDFKYQVRYRFFKSYWKNP